MARRSRSFVEVSSAVSSTVGSSHILLQSESERRHSSGSSLSSLQQPQPLQQQNPSWFVIKVTAIASLGGILFGYDLGVISGALPQLITAFDLTRPQQEFVVSILYVGGGIGASLGGALCDACGRKQAILYTDVSFLIGAALLFAAPNVTTLAVGRIVVGFAVACSGIADVCYLNEIAPSQYRGAVVSVNEACIALGFLLAFGIASLDSLTETNSESPWGWRVMFGLSGILALIQLLGMWNMPESPKWLSEQGRIQECQAALRSIQQESGPVVLELGTTAKTNATTTTCVTLDDYQATAATTFTKSSEATESAAVHRKAQAKCRWYLQQLVYLCQQLGVFVSTTMNHYRKQAEIALFLAVAQQLSGQTNVLSYAPLIFDQAGQSSTAWATLSIGLIKFIVTVLVIWKIERLGRRFLLLTGMGTICFGLLLLTLAFWNTDSSSSSGEITTNNKGLALPGILLVVCGYSMSFGPLTWLLTSEIFPTDIRGRALGATTIVTYLMASAVTYTFLSAQAWLGPSLVFGAYLVVTGMGWCFAFLAIPDTGGKSVSEIENDLKQMYWWRTTWSGQTVDDTSPLFQSLPEPTMTASNQQQQSNANGFRLPDAELA